MNGRAFRAGVIAGIALLLVILLAGQSARADEPPGFPPGFYEAEDYASFGGYGMSCTYEVPYSVFNIGYDSRWSAGEALRFIGAGPYCTIPFYGSSITLWRRFNYPAAASSPGYVYFQADGDSNVFIDNGTITDPMIYSLPFTITFAESGYHVLLIASSGTSTNRELCLDRFAVFDLEATPEVTPIVRADYLVVDRMPDPAVYFADAGGQVAAVELSITAGDVLIIELTFALFVLGVVALAVRIWSRA